MKSLACAVAALLALSRIGCAQAEAEAGAEASAATCIEAAALSPARTVVKVDGATLSLDDGSEVQLAGIALPLPPLSAEWPERWPLEEEAEVALRALVAGRPIAIASVDGGRADRYGRRSGLAFVRRDGAAPEFVQAALLKQGHARVAVARFSPPCLAAMLSEEAAARSARLGLWASPAYAPREAGDTATLLRQAGTLQLVQGTIERVAWVRGGAYLNFGPDWRRDFTVRLRLPRGADTDVARRAVDELAGVRVQVRGYIERRNGPLVEIFDPALIERANAP